MEVGVKGGRRCGVSGPIAVLKVAFKLLVVAMRGLFHRTRAAYCNKRGAQLYNCVDPSPTFGSTDSSLFVGSDDGAPMYFTRSF